MIAAICPCPWFPSTNDDFCVSFFFWVFCHHTGAPSTAGNAHKWFAVSKEAQKRLTESYCTPVMELGHMNAVLVFLGIGIIIIIIIIISTILLCYV